MLQRHGHDMVCELEAFVQNCQERGLPFPADVPPYFIQGSTALAALIYDVPAFPHVLCFASVCRSWFESIKRAVFDQFYVNTHRLLVLHSSGTILWNGFIDLMMIAFASVHR